MRKPPIRNERGSALVVTLWASLILSVIAVELAYSTRLELRTLAYGERNAQAVSLARSAANAGIARIAGNIATGSPARVLVAEDGSWHAPTGQQPVRMPQNIVTGTSGDKAGSFTEQIIDESGKLDANTADEPQLASLLKSVGVQNAAQAAKSIVIYRATRPGAKFLSVDEIANVPGLDTQALFGEDTNGNGLLDENENDGDKTAPDDNGNGRLEAGIAAYITAAPAHRISINLAALPVIQAVLGATKDQAAELAALRDSLGGTLSSLEQLRALPWMTSDMLKEAGEKFSVQSELFIVRAEASAEGGPRQSAVAYVLNAAGGTQTFLWREKKL